MGSNKMVYPDLDVPKNPKKKQASELSAKNNDLAPTLRPSNPFGGLNPLGGLLSKDKPTMVNLKTKNLLKNVGKSDEKVSKMVNENFGEDEEEEKRLDMSLGDEDDD